MDELAQSLIWIAPLLFGVMSWLASKYRESVWGQELSASVGLKRREHEQEWEFRRRLGSIWLSVAALIGVMTYQLGQRLLHQGSNTEQWELLAFAVFAIFFVWSVSKSARSFWASRRES